jgi:hypothetical protein
VAGEASAAVVIYRDNTANSAFQGGHVARDPETIERDIEKAREALAATLDRISEKADPKQLADSARSTVQAKLDEPKIKYPLIGAGLLLGVLLLRKLLR